MKRALSLLLACLFVMACAAGCDSKNSGSSGTDFSKGIHHATIEIQDYGTVTLELDADAAPITVQNFVSLAQSGFYDGLTFHRMQFGFVLQGGDPQGNGMGGSEETIKGEFAANKVNNPISHTRGVISMARGGYSYDSASSQFFIVLSDDYTSSLDGLYAAFGKVTDGMDVIDRVCADLENCATDSMGTLTAADQPVMKRVTVID